MRREGHLRGESFLGAWERQCSRVHRAQLVLLRPLLDVSFANYPTECTLDVYKTE